MKSETAIVIIGAGISGFTAAAKLNERGFKNITILEAENRIGGRIHTTKFSGGFIDLGAQWCHGVEGNIVHQLAGGESFAETKMDFSKMNFARSDGEEIDKFSCEILMRLCDSILEEIKLESSGTVEELLTLKFLKALESKLESKEFSKIDRNLALEVLNNFKKRESSYCGCESLDKISADGFNKFRDCNGPTWLNWKGKGYQKIFDYVAKSSSKTKADIEKLIQLNKQVVSINWNEGPKVIIKCSDGELFSADHVIVTVSLGVLKQRHLTLFTPELPIEKQEAIDKISIFGAVGKIFLKFEEKFWEDDWVGLSLIWREEDLNEISGTKNAWLENIYCFYTVDFLPNVLLGRLAGDKIEDMEKLTDEEIIQSVQMIFKKFMPHQKIGNVTEVMTSKWKSKENFRGTYSYHTEDTSSAKNLSEPLFGKDGNLKICFAGESTHDFFFSTVHGAIESGYREAERIYSLMNL